MTILGIDSATPSASVALSRDGSVLASYRSAAGNTHSECLLPMIESVLSLCGVGVSDLDLIGCGVGPGSFTGVRIGVSAAKGLAAPRDIPCVGVSSIEGAASLACDGALVVPVFNARRGNVYSAIFQSKDGDLCRLSDDMIISVDELCEKLAARGETVVFTGDAADECFEAARSANIAARSVDPGEKLPDAARVCALCERKWEAAGEAERRLFTAEALAPVYLRPGRVASAALPE